MSPRHRRLAFSALACVALAAASAASAQPAATAGALDQELRAAALEYQQRIETATAELNDTRERIAREKIPLLNQMRDVEERILQTRAELANLRIDAGRFDDERALRDQEANTQRLNLGYLAGLAAEGINTLGSSLNNLETTQWQDRLAELRQRLDPTQGSPDLAATVESVTLLVDRVETLLGGYTVTGRAVAAPEHALVDGTFAFMGPEAFFVAATPGGPAGTVRAREEGAAPMVYPLAEWDATTAAALIAGQPASVPADVSGGKALQLRQSQGDWLDHIRKGGVVGYAIIGLGLFALLTALMKLADLRNLAVDAPPAVAGLLQHVITTGAAGAEARLTTLRRTSRDLLATGLRHYAKPKEVIEEHLHAFILRERIHHERWLPMLAVIAAASPLLGLLGTVVGMVKTFTLITVFGTGNAGKLSSGISEALVTTELGLTVAIPVLVLHGFLSHRTQKGLSLLERYAVEFVTAAEDRKSSPAPVSGR